MRQTLLYHFPGNVKFSLVTKHPDDLDIKALYADGDVNTSLVFLEYGPNIKTSTPELVRKVKCVRRFTL